MKFILKIQSSKFNSVCKTHVCYKFSSISTKLIIITYPTQLHLHNCAMLFLNHIIKYFYQHYNFIPKGIIKQKRLMSNNIRQEINEKTSLQQINLNCFIYFMNGMKMIFFLQHLRFLLCCNFFYQIVHYRIMSED